MATEKADYEVLWPRGRKSIVNRPPAQRLGSLEGKTVCEMWDLVFRGNELYPMIEQALRTRYPGMKFVDHRLFGCVHAGDEKDVLERLPALLKENKCDALISGMGC